MSGFYEREQRSDDVAYRLLREEVEKEKEKNKDTEAGGVKETETETNEEPKKKKTLKETLEEFQPQIMIFNVLTPDRKSPKLKGDHAVRIVTLKQMVEDSVDDIVGKLKLKSQLQSDREHRLEGVTFPGYDKTPDYLKNAIDKIVDDNKIDLQFDKVEKEIERTRGDDGKLTGKFIDLTNFIGVFKAAIIEKQKEDGVSNFADDDEDGNALTQFMNWAFGSIKNKSDEEEPGVVVNMALPKMRTPRRNNNNSQKMVSEAIEQLQKQEQGAIEQEQEQGQVEESAQEEIEDLQEEPVQEEIEPSQEVIEDLQEVEDTKATRDMARKDAGGFFSRLF